MNQSDWIILGVMVGLAVILGGMWLWRWWQDNRVQSSKTITRHDMNLARIAGVETDPDRSRKLSQEQYVRDLDRVIEDTERMAESLTDGEERDLWFLYVQELRVRQLKVIQRVQDKEWRKVRGDSLTREEMREVERVALQEIRRMEERYFNPEDIRKFSMEGRY